MPGSFVFFESILLDIGGLTPFWGFSPAKTWPDAPRAASSDRFAMAIAGF
jgi:hypothetical protein